MAYIVKGTNGRWNIVAKEIENVGSDYCFLGLDNKVRALSESIELREEVENGRYCNNN